MPSIRPPLPPAPPLPPTGLPRRAAAPPAAFEPLVLVPAFNHAPALGAVLAGLPAGTPALVVDDGSTDATGAVVTAAATRRADLFRLRHADNRGKAAALHTGFAWAMGRGFTHAVTLDADGQHDPAAVPAMLAASAADRGSLVLGVRPGRLPGTPLRSAVGRSVSDRSVRLACGLRVSDSQTGMRVYPLAAVVRAGCTASRFGFETEVIVRCHRLGVRVVEVPVGGRYAVATGRVTHFRPVADSLRGLRLHARLVAERLRGAGRRAADTPAAT
ncbi:glycosyltransferase family 2 protein [Phycisphaera mikurensis]|uniref:Putative glycosyltransferase n=1 Tax=Phycisphaera mikurensis (strain NBRC 102666 / KCTC 22515 / FYK2301M01) TaxID=1142394 RepID=I0IJ09_PHYMF|nr:glycosyltransferase family 2 protein [Phycisphaera mikurensis]MBB6443094.1 glycosyltransferase involved in cell wall biosynthesis [Phycisphaera mikurensis]BAM05247.1 putative glycosyltransferase [Phycisphaera mikurensis NBRC 102666]